MTAHLKDTVPRYYPGRSTRVPVPPPGTRVPGVLLTRATSPGPRGSAFPSHVSTGARFHGGEIVHGVRTTVG
eukprot:1799815-Rhodomonas_salina.2